jgi:hypothetical protein
MRVYSSGAMHTIMLNSPLGCIRSLLADSNVLLLDASIVHCAGFIVAAVQTATMGMVIGVVCHCTFAIAIPCVEADAAYDMLSVRFVCVKTVRAHTENSAAPVAVHGMRGVAIVQSCNRSLESEQALKSISIRDCGPVQSPSARADRLIQFMPSV